MHIQKFGNIYRFDTSHFFIITTLYYEIVLKSAMPGTDPQDLSL